MIAGHKWLWPLVAAVALLQSVAIAKIVYDRHALLKSGREITMDVVPVDPRDIFRGDYVILGYGLDPIDGKLIAPDLQEAIRSNDSVFVTIRPSTTPTTWQVVKVTAAYPDTIEASDAVLKGRVTWVNAQQDENRKLSVRYGIENYFVPEGKGRDLEQAVRDGKVQAVVAVGGDGTAALKGLIVNGERRIDPPLL